MNYVGFYTCTCNNGYKGDGHECEEENECDIEAYYCHDDATCENHSVNFTCTCNDGYVGDGLDCKRMF